MYKAKKSRNKLVFKKIVILNKIQCKMKKFKKILDIGANKNIKNFFKLKKYMEIILNKLQII